MEALGVVATISSLVEVTAKVFGLCQEYYSAVKGAREEIRRLSDEVMSLQDILINLAELDETSVKLSTLNTLNQPHGPIQECQARLNGLLERLNPGQGKNQMKRFGLRALSWPFNRKDVDETVRFIERQKALFNLALTADAT